MEISGSTLTGYVYVAQLPDAPLVGVAGGTVEIPATTGGAENDLIIIVVKKGSPSAFADGLSAKDMYMHRGDALVLLEGDEAYVVPKDATYPSTEVSGTLEHGTVDVMTQKDRGYAKTVETGTINFPVTLSGFAEKGNELQTKIAQHNVKVVRTAGDGGVTVKAAARTIIVGAIMRWDGQSDVDHGILFVGTPAGTPHNLQPGSAQDFSITLNPDSIANPTMIEVEA